MKDYADRIEELAQRYEPRALSILNRIRAELVQAGVDCVEPYQMFDDNYRWAFATKNAKGHVGKGSVDYTIEIAEQRDYDGADADPGINFGLSVAEWGGPIRGEFNPFNFTPQVWVDAYDDDDAVESRWQIFAEVDVQSAAALAIPTDKRGQKRMNNEQHRIKQLAENLLATLDTVVPSSTIHYVVENNRRWLKELAANAETIQTVEPKTWTFFGHWQNGRIVEEYYYPGEVQDDRIDNGDYEEGLWAGAGGGATVEEARAAAIAEYENDEDEDVSSRSTPR